MSPQSRSSQCLSFSSIEISTALRTQHFSHNKRKVPVVTYPQLGHGKNITAPLCVNNLGVIDFALFDCRLNRVLLLFYLVQRILGDFLELGDVDWDARNLKIGVG